MHKSTPASRVSYLKKNRSAPNSSADPNSSQNAKSKEDISSAASKIEVIDIDRENRLSKVISLYSNGLNQEEIAKELYVDQSRISRDLQYVKLEARIKIEKYLRDDILF